VKVTNILTILKCRKGAQPLVRPEIASNPRQMRQSLHALFQNGERWLATTTASKQLIANTSNLATKNQRLFAPESIASGRQSLVPFQAYRERKSRKQVKSSKSPQTRSQGAK
jgi:hypothetical protein